MMNMTVHICFNKMEINEVAVFESFLLIVTAEKFCKQNKTTMYCIRQYKLMKYDFCFPCQKIFLNLYEKKNHAHYQNN